MAMYELKLSEQQYLKAKENASAHGFASVEQYLEVLLTDDADPEENYDAKFTPEVLAYLDGISARAKAGSPGRTLEDFDKRLAEVRKEWLKNHPA